MFTVARHQLLPAPRAFLMASQRFTFIRSGRRGMYRRAVGDACIGVPTPSEHRYYDRDRDHRSVVIEHHHHPVVIEHHRHTPVVIHRDEDED
jgi:hypothetical protein